MRRRGDNKMKTMVGGLLVAALMATTTPAAAAVAYQVQNGKLVGATGVVIGQSTYNVTFADNSCTLVFGSCSANKFDFTTKASAITAGNALLSQVLIGIYQTSPGRVFGCNSSTCDSFIPYKLYDDDSGYAQAVVVANRGRTNRFVTGDVYPGANESTALNQNVNYVRFTLQAAAVPETATWGMMITGFGMIGGGLRSRRRSGKIRFA